MGEGGDRWLELPTERRGGDRGSEEEACCRSGGASESPVGAHQRYRRRRRRAGGGGDSRLLDGGEHREAGCRQAEGDAEEHGSEVRVGVRVRDDRQWKPAAARRATLYDHAQRWVCAAAQSAEREEEHEEGRVARRDESHRGERVPHRAAVRADARPGEQHAGLQREEDHPELHGASEGRGGHGGERGGGGGGRGRGEADLQPAESAHRVGRQADPLLAVQAIWTGQGVQVRDLRKPLVLGPARVR